MYALQWQTGRHRQGVTSARTTRITWAQVVFSTTTRRCSRGVLVTNISAAAPGSSVAGYALCPAACLANPTQGSGRPRATHHAQAWIPVTPTTPSSFSSSASCCRRSIQISFGLKRFATFFLSCRRLLGCALQRASLSAASASTTPTFVTCSASGCYYSIL